MDKTRLAVKQNQKTRNTKIQNEQYELIKKTASIRKQKESNE